MAISPPELMAYTTPLIILIFQQWNAFASARRGERMQEKLDSVQAAAALAQRDSLVAAQAIALSLKESSAEIAARVAQGKAASDEKLDEIHKLVNGNAADSKETIRQLTDEVAFLRRTIADFTRLKRQDSSAKISDPPAVT